MALWEYKVISSGKGGFASPALMEKFLNDLGKDEWEIIDFRTQPDNVLAFSGLARRTTQRDWTLEDAAAAAARTEADKLRAEFEAKFRSASSGTESEAAAAAVNPAAEKAAEDDGFRRLRDTERDQDPDAPDEDEPKDEWDQLGSQDELPTFFEALRPHMRRNQRGPGMAVGIEYLSKKWDLSEDDLKGALAECGLAIPADDDAKPEYVEFEGDLYWVNINRRGEIWINTKEKPRPVFRTVAAQKVASETVEDPAAEPGAVKSGDDRGGRSEGDRKGDDGRNRQQGREAGRQESASRENAPSEPLPAGPELLERIRPHMRRNRRGPGGSGSSSFLARALKCREAELVEAFKALGLTEPAVGEPDPAPIEIGDGFWFLNRDQRGGLWINGRLKSEEAPAEAAPKADAAPGVPSVPAEGEAAPAPASVPSAPAPASGSTLFDEVRPHLAKTRAGSLAAEIGALSRTLGRDEATLVADLVAAGLHVPEKPREKPVHGSHGEDVFWFSRNGRGEIWLNAKSARSAGDGEEEGDDEKKSRRPRSKKTASADSE